MTQSEEDLLSRCTHSHKKFQSYFLFVDTTQECTYTHYLESEVIPTPIWYLAVRIVKESQVVLRIW